MAETGINKGGMSLWCGLRPFLVVWQSCLKCMSVSHLFLNWNTYFLNQSLFAMMMDVICGDMPLIHVDEIWHHSQSNLLTLRLLLTNSTWCCQHCDPKSFKELENVCYMVWSDNYYYANLICRLYRLTPKCVSNTSCGFWSMPGWPDVWAAKSSCSLFCTLWTCITGGRNASSIEEDSLL